MSSSKPVHECLFCPQTFDTAIAKDDHVLEHFAQETCTECNQHLIRIGSILYSQHNATACTKMTVKSEVIDKSISDNPKIPASEYVNQHEGPVYDENHTEDDVPSITPIEIDEIHIKDEPNEGGERQNTFESLNDFEAQSNYSGSPKMEWIDFQPEDNTVAWSGFSFDGNLANCDRSALEENQQQTTIMMENGHTSCDICGKVLSSKSALRTHTNLLHSQQCEEFECNVCKFKCKTKGSLRKHLIRKHHPDKDKLTCKICHQVFVKESSLQSHPCRRKEEFISCNVCGKIFRHRQSFRMHQMKYHHVEEYTFSDVRADIFSGVEDFNAPLCEQNLYKSKKMFKNSASCNICGKVLSTKSALRTHTTLLHSEQSIEFECHICKMKFKLKGGLRKHMIGKHDPSVDKLKCKICHQIFMKESSIQSHTCNRKRISSMKPASCDICGKVLSTKSALRTHKILLHSGQCIEFECHICKMKFRLKGGLRKHMIREHDPRVDKLKCKMCHQVFMKESSLQSHLCRRRKIRHL